MICDNKSLSEEAISRQPSLFFSLNDKENVTLRIVATALLYRNRIVYLSLDILTDCFFTVSLSALYLDLPIFTYLGISYQW